MDPYDDVITWNNRFWSIYLINGAYYFESLVIIMFLTLHVSLVEDMSPEDCRQVVVLVLFTSVNVDMR